MIPQASKAPRALGTPISSSVEVRPTLDGVARGVVLSDCFPTEIGTNLQANNCPTSGSGGNNCFAAFLALHLTPSSSAYLEVRLVLSHIIQTLTTFGLSRAGPMGMDRRP